MTTILLVLELALVVLVTLFLAGLAWVWFQQPVVDWTVVAVGAWAFGKRATGGTGNYQRSARQRS